MGGIRSERAKYQGSCEYYQGMVEITTTCTQVGWQVLRTGIVFPRFSVFYICDADIVKWIWTYIFRRSKIWTADWFFITMLLGNECDTKMIYCRSNRDLFPFPTAMFRYQWIDEESKFIHINGFRVNLAKVIYPCLEIYCTSTKFSPLFLRF
jgi:hypothetical protein